MMKKYLTINLDELMEQGYFYTSFDIGDRGHSITIEEDVLEEFLEEFAQITKERVRDLLCEDEEFEENEEDEEIEEEGISICIEEKILKNLFGYEGELATTGRSEFDFLVLGQPGHIVVKLNQNKAELYFDNKWNLSLEEVKELSEEDIEELKNEGYDW